MKSETKIYVVIACVICLAVGILAGYLPGYYSGIQNHGDILTQVSTIDAILNGLYDGVITYGDLKQYGDFGIGTFNALDGEMVAVDGNFYCPDYFAGLNVVPYHLHFITEDRKAGGHVLEFIIKDVELSVDYTSELRMILPDTEEFNSLNLTKSRIEELEKAEK